MHPFRFEAVTAQPDGRIPVRAASRSAVAAGTVLLGIVLLATPGCSSSSRSTVGAGGPQASTLGPQTGASGSAGGAGAISSGGLDTRRTAPRAAAIGNSDDPRVTSAAGDRTAQQNEDGADGHRAAPDAGARGGDAGAGDSDADSSLPKVALTPQLLFELLASEIALQRGEVAAAFNTQYSLARQTRDPRIARRATQMALAGHSLQQALASSRLWAELDPASAEAKEAQESLLLATGRLSEAEPLLQRRLQQARDQRALNVLYPQWQRFFAQVDQHQEAWRLFDRLSAPDRNVASARLARAYVAASAGELDIASDEADAAQALEPNNSEAAIAAAQYRGAQSGGRAKAIETLLSFVARNPDDGNGQLALGQVFLADNQPIRAQAALRRAAALKPASPQTLFTLAQSQYRANDLDGAEATLNQYLALPDSVEREDAPAWLFLGQISEDRGNAQQAIERLSRIEDGELYLNALGRRAVLMARNGDPDGAQKLLAQAPARTSREEGVLIAMRAQVLRETGRHREAFELLTQAVAQRPDDAELLYDQAMAAERIGRIDQLESSLRRVIKLRPDNAHAYNALGYTLADRNLRLSEALHLIEKAISLQPDDPQIIDSLGWVQYRLKRNASAIESLRKAYSLKPEVDIGAHLGEALWASGQREEAMYIWREGLAREPGNETLTETLRRLGVRP